MAIAPATTSTPSPRLQFRPVQARSFVSEQDPYIAEQRAPLSVKAYFCQQLLYTRSPVVSRQLYQRLDDGGGSLQSLGPCLGLSQDVLSIMASGSPLSPPSKSIEAQEGLLFLLFLVSCTPRRPRFTQDMFEVTHHPKLWIRRRTSSRATRNASMSAWRLVKGFGEVMTFMPVSEDKWRMAFSIHLPG